ncbi:MAG: large repetitive protein [Hyphomicrobiales bacterium]|jgi:hypothetical protein|nr:large repetitive protein [Hyphomicrobiales bacterium]
MVWVVKNSSGANYGGGATDYVWVADEPSATHSPIYNAPQNPAPAGVAPTGYNGVPAEEQHTPPASPAGDPAPSATTGTSGADTFVLDRGTLAAATATPPAPLQIQGFNAAQGDTLDFSAVLAASYAPLSADTVQLRLTDHGGAAAALEFNVGAANHAFWVAVAQLDGIHAGDAVNVSLDAGHTLHLTALWAV